MPLPRRKKTTRVLPVREKRVEKIWVYYGRQWCPGEIIGPVSSRRKNKSSKRSNLPSRVSREEEKLKVRIRWRLRWLELILNPSQYRPRFC